SVPYFSVSQNSGSRSIVQGPIESGSRQTMEKSLTSPSKPDTWNNFSISRVAPEANNRPSLDVPLNYNQLSTPQPESRLLIADGDRPVTTDRKGKRRAGDIRAEMQVEEINFNPSTGVKSLTRSNSISHQLGDREQLHSSVLSRSKEAPLKPLRHRSLRESVEAYLGNGRKRVSEGNNAKTIDENQQTNAVSTSSSGLGHIKSVPCLLERLSDPSPAGTSSVSPSRQCCPQQCD
ncbi:hypothetical protein AMATHDRAFT_54816, partial [Amanita thiersii Skay4041]